MNPKEMSNAELTRYLRDASMAPDLRAVLEEWRARMQVCEVCFTSSWAPCPEGTPDAVPDGQGWMVCHYLCDIEAQRDALRKAIGIVLRNVGSGAVTTAWIQGFLEARLELAGILPPCPQCGDAADPQTRRDCHGWRWCRKCQEAFDAMEPKEE